MEPLLLVEDKNELRAMLRKALERAGYTVDDAADGSTAVNKIRARRYLVVLTDLKLPGCSGLDILRETKQADPAIPVILITAFGSVEEAVTAMKGGAFDFIQKPVDLDHLKLLVERAAQQQELLRENLLLREERGFDRVDGTQPVDVDVRILAATNKDLRAAVEGKSFREDLYFRISAVPITIPPLRARGEDVLLLAEYFLERFRREFRKPALELSADAKARLTTYPWPGHVRDMQHPSALT